MIKTNLLASSAVALVVSLTAAHAQSTVQPQTAPAQNTTPQAVAPARVPGGPEVQSTANGPERISTAVSITETQRTQISRILSSARSAATAVGFQLAAGTPVPQAVHLESLPPEVGAVASEYRGKSYFVTADAIVIVNPANREILSAFSFSDKEQALVPAVTRQAVVLSPAQRDTIRREVAPGAAVGPAPAVKTHAVAVGDLAPASIALEEFPANVSNEIPAVRPYRYYRSGEEVVIVDPSDRHVLSVVN